MTRTTITALAFSLCTAGLLLTSCSDGEKTGTQLQQRSVKVFPIQKKTVTDTGEWMGYLRGVQDTDLYPRVSGFIVSYKEGQYVEEGEVIYQIDPKPFEAELARAKANLDAANASLEQAQVNRDQLQLDVDRYTQLVKTGAVSDKQLTDAQHNLNAAKAKVDACLADIKQQEASVMTAEINLQYAGVKAPYSGFVGTSNVSTGALVGPSTKLGNITSDGPLRVDFSINSDALLDSFKRYGKVESDKQDPELKDASPEFELLLEDGSTYAHKGKLLSMNSKVDSTGLIDIVGEIANPEGKLRGGMKINVKIPLSTKEAMLVPESAIRTVMRNNFILVVDKQNVPHSLPVTTEGVYEVEIEEADGFKSTQKLVAVSGYQDKSLTDAFKSYGYEDVTAVPVVADADNGVQAMNISSANARISQEKKALEEARKEQENSLLSSLLVAVGLEDEVPSPDTIKPASILTETLSFKPNAPIQAANQQQKPLNTNAKATLPPALVKVAPLLQQDVCVSVDWYGTVRGKEETEIRPQISGFLLKQHFRNGTIVKEGDVLFTIDPAPYEAALAQAKANLDSSIARKEAAMVELEKAQSDLERYTKANETTHGAVAEKDITDARSAVQTKQAALRQAEAAVEQMNAAVLTAEINLSYTTIKAPFTGRAGISNPSIGSLVSPSAVEPLVTLSSVNPMRVDFQVSGRDALQITNRVGKNNPNGGMEFDILLENGSLYPAKGKIVSPDNVVKKSTGTFGIVGEVENVTNGLRSGMPVTVRAGLREFKNAYLVPARAPMNADGNDIIILLGADNAPTPLPIKRGPIVTIPVTGPDGKEVIQPMQIVEINPQILQAVGFPDPSQVKVIVEGTIPAGMALQANMKANGRANKVIPRDFIYTAPKTVEPSITADKAPVPNLNKF
ncbi:MAG: efflux RND transporter periplasmic adaptor subunit [Akkermansia sp.]|nr:efflux RND transporter periplasmic adaptor subunit [Akkermansia sp.]